MMRLLITAGPTREPIDAVRYIGNRSSGKLGIALAQAAAKIPEIQVELLAGPGVDVQVLAAIDRLRVERFETAAQLESLLQSHFGVCDVLVMAAAVGDYRSATTTTGKLARNSKDLTLTLTPTPDLVAGCAARKRADQRIVAFALEAPEGLESRAREKLERKGADAIVANPLGTMEADAIKPTWLTAGGERLAGESMSKENFAIWLLERIDALRSS